MLSNLGSRSGHSLHLSSLPADRSSHCPLWCEESDTRSSRRLLPSRLYATRMFFYHKTRSPDQTYMYMHMTAKDNVKCGSKVPFFMWLRNFDITTLTFSSRTYQCDFWLAALMTMKWFNTCHVEPLGWADNCSLPKIMSDLVASYCTWRSASVAMLRPREYSTIVSQHRNWPRVRAASWRSKGRSLLRLTCTISYQKLFGYMHHTNTQGAHKISPWYVPIWGRCDPKLPILALSVSKKPALHKRHSQGAFNKIFNKWDKLQLVER